MLRISHKKLISFSKITVYFLSGNHITDTYDVGFTLSANGELKLQIAVETATNNV